MSWVATAVIGSAVIGAGATAVASKSQNKAITAAAAAEQQASAANIQAAERERARNEALFAPEVGRGNRADAYLDALYYGTGSFSGAPPAGSAYSAQPAQSLEDILRAQNPDMAQRWDAWEANNKNKPNGHRATFGDFAGYVRAERPQALTEAQSQYSQSVAPIPTGSDPNATTVNRSDALAQIASNPLIGIGEQNYSEQMGLADSGYASERALAERGLSDRYGDAAAEYAAQDGITNNEFLARMSEADRARADREGVGQTAYDGRVGLLTEDFDTRRGYTDKAITDRAQLNAIYQGQAQDRTASMLGLTGQVGKAARAGAERANELNLEFADTERQWRNEDYDPYASGRYAAYSDLARVREGAAERFADDSSTAITGRSGAQRVNTSNLYDRRAGAYDTYEGIDLSGLRTRNNRYGVAQNDRNASRLAAYGDWQDYMTGQSSRGAAGRGAISSAGQSTLGITSGERTNAARSAADAAYARGNVAADSANAYGAIAGDAFGSLSGILKQKKY